MDHPCVGRAIATWADRRRSINPNTEIRSRGMTSTTKIMVGAEREAVIDIMSMTLRVQRDVEQWEIVGKWDWTPLGNTFGDKTWVDCNRFPDWNDKTKGRFRVKCFARNTKQMNEENQRKTGETHWPGTEGWHWTWQITEILEVNPAPTPSTNGGGSDQVEFRRSKELMNWIEALKIAARLYGKEHTKVHIDYARIRSIAIAIYAEITTGPPQEEAEPAYPDATEMGSDAPEMAVEAVSPSQPQTTTAPPTTRPQRPPPKCSDAKWKQLNQARYDKDGTEVYSGDDVVNHIATNYAERGPRDLVDAEIDAVIEALIAGQIKAAKVANDTAIF
jgi:hypothetical protein